MAQGKLNRKKKKKTPKTLIQKLTISIQNRYFPLKAKIKTASPPYIIS